VSCELRVCFWSLLLEFAFGICFWNLLLFGKWIVKLE
jgi:hypothetical protein